MQDTQSASNLLVSDKVRIDLLKRIFYDALVLDFGFKILSIGNLVATDLGYSQNELVGQSITDLIPNFSNELLPLLQEGVFTQKNVSFRTNSKTYVSVNVSGFYSGIFTDVNGCIVLRYENLDNINFVRSMLEAKTREMDHFIYQASHSLRGPLATIRGLINIAKTESKPENLAFIHLKMEEFADRLDTKLYKLMCFAEADRVPGIPTGKIDGVKLQYLLSERVSNELATRNVSITCHVAEMPRLLVNENLVEALLVNLVVFVASSASERKGEIMVGISGDEKAVRIELRANGFSPDVPILELVTGERGYGHLLEKPDLTNLYSAQKVIFRLRGSMYLEATNSDSSVLRIEIPYNFISLSKK